MRVMQPARVVGNFLRRSRPTGIRSFSSSSDTAPTHGVVFDVDGVLVLGKQVVPEAPAALQKLRADGVPHVFMTNGGGATEAAKAAQLSDRFGVPIEAGQVILCHTPMRALAEEYGRKRVLVCGKGYASLRAICDSYGFDDAVTAEELHAAQPLLYPDIAPHSAPSDAGPSAAAGGDAAAANLDWTKPFAAVLVMIDPLAWGRELQLCLDVLQSAGGVVGTRAPDATLRAEGPAVPLFDACADFEYAAEFPTPRLGAGSFRVALEAMFAASTRGGDLGTGGAHTLYGKPHGASYAFAERALAALAGADGAPPARIYGIGDNPETDIAGANGAGPRWRSVLTRGGLWQGGPGENDRAHPADLVADGVADALDAIARIEAREAAGR